MIGSPTRVTIFTEELQIPAYRLVEVFWEMIHEGNVLRVIVRDDLRRQIAEFPQPVDALDGILQPQMAAVAAIAGLAPRFTLLVDRVGIDGPLD